MKTVGVAFAVCALLAVACDGPAPVDAGRDAGSSDAGATDAASPALPDPWSARAAPDVAGVAILERDAWLTEANEWWTRFDPILGTPARTHRGGQPVGNGEVFAFVGLGEPDLLTVRELVGPGYDMGEAFFGDLTFEFELAGEAWTATQQTQWRVRDTDIVVTLARGPGLTVTVIDVAPRVRPTWVGVAAPVERAFLRHIVAEPEDPSATLAISVRGVGWTADGATLVQTRDDRTATVTARAPAIAVASGPDTIRSDASDLWLAFVTARGDTERDETLSGLDATEHDTLLMDTRDAWRSWVGSGARVVTDPPRVGALIDATRIHVRAQQSSTGATSPMSLYTRTWLRDTAGPVRLLAALGHHGAVGEMLDAQYDEILRRGDFANSMSASRRDPPPTAPDFASLGPLPDRVRAESVSHVVLSYDEHARWTGETERVDTRWAHLRRAIVDQHVDADGWLPFSGDETYRTAMAFAHGLALIEEFVDGYRSLDSSAIFVDAARRLARHGDALGRSADADTLRALADRVEAAAFRLFGPTAERAWWAPYATATRDTYEPAALPFEDASLQAAIHGLDPDPASLRALWQELETDRGFAHSPRDERYAVLLRSQGAELGIHTGMSAGFFLSATSRLELGLDGGAFDAVGRTAASSGCWPEYAVFDDHSNLTLGYDPSGERGDDTARVRPWEGGLDARALLDHLFGVAPGELELVVAPHLPPSTRRAELRGARVGDTRFDVIVEGASGAIELVRVDVHEGAIGALRLVLAVEGVAEVRVDGEVTTPEGSEPLGDRTRLVMPARALAAGESVEISLDR